MAEPPATIRTESNGPLVSGISIGFLSATVLFIALRFYTRRTILNNIGKDDWTMLVATLFSLINTVAMLLEVKYGMGRHVENVTLEETVEQLKFLLVAILNYNMGMNVVKLGFLFQYRRIFRERLIQRICLWSIVYVCVWACIQATLLSLTCLPISIIVPKMAGTCLDTLPIWYFSSGMSMATDIVIFCIPLPSVWKLQLPLRQGFVVLGIFCMGFFVCIISVYRMFTLRAGVISQDPTWENIGAAIWSCIELNISIVSSLPTLRPLIARILPGFGLSTAGTKPTAYLRYGSATAGGTRSGTAKMSLNKATEMHTISVEELTPKDMAPSPSSSISAAVYAHASASHIGHAYVGGEHGEGRIMKKTEISVNAESRNRAR